MRPHTRLKWALEPLVRSQSRKQSLDLSRRYVSATDLLATDSNSQALRLKRSRDLLSKHQPSLEACKLSKEDAEYWEKVVAGLDKQQSLERLKGMDFVYAFGVTSRMLTKRPSCFEDFMKAKLKHPQRIVICKIGEFYESFGLDAVLLMHFCALNNMGNRTIPHAGFPICNLREMMKRLVNVHGMSVVIIEEVPMLPGLRAGKRFERHIGGVLTPARPTYLYNRVENRVGEPQDMDVAHPLLGVAATVSGYRVVEVNVDLLTYTVQDGLTADSVSSRLHRGGLAPPLYIHRVERGGALQLTEATAEREWEQRIAASFRTQAGGVQFYHSSDAIAGLLESIIRDQDLPADTRFSRLAPDPQTRPKALFQCTAGQLGLHQMKGIPSLLDKLLPPGTPRIERAYLRQLLLHPPSPDVAASVSRACSMLSSLEVPLPRWVVVDSNHVARFIKAKQCHVDDFRSLKAVLRGVHAATDNGRIRRLAEEVLCTVSADTRLHFECDSLRDSCRTIADEIDNVVEDAVDQPEREDRGDAAVGFELDALALLLEKNEGFRGKVREALIGDELGEVNRAARMVAGALEDAIAPLMEAGDVAKNQPRASFDPVNNAVWLKVVRGSKASDVVRDSNRRGGGGPGPYVTPLDRNGKAARLRDLWSTAALEEALADYRAACDAAQQAVRSQLQLLATRLEGRMNDLVGATHFSLVASTLEKHVREAMQRGWALPRQLQPGESAQASRAEAAGSPISVEGMWPYWLDGRSSDTVRNSFDLDSLVILTGPNMAGKSTFMRSLCAVTVLGAAGLYAPVSAATLPYTDAFMLRTFSADSPIDGQSSFAIEMSEVRHVAENVSEHSLVLVDELGKGTEPVAGTCIAASFVEFLAGKCCRGMFATHLHQLLDLQGTQLQAVRHVHMETVPAAEAGSAGGKSTDKGMGSIKEIAARMGERVPTWKIKPGACSHSLAFVVMAQHCGEGHGLVQRAVELYRGWQSRPAPGDHADLSASLRHADPATESRSTAKPPTIEAAAPLEPPSPPFEASLAIEDAERLLAGTARHVFARLAGVEDRTGLGAAPVLRDADDGTSSSPDAGCVRNTWNGAAVPDTQIVRRGEEPPPSTVGRSCVYVVMRSDGKFYAGETDDIKGRIATHRRTRSGRVRGGAHLEAVYTVVPPELQGKSAAKDLEAHLIGRLDAEGFPMLSVADGRTRRSPVPRAAEPGLRHAAAGAS